MRTLVAWVVLMGTAFLSKQFGPWVIGEKDENFMTLLFIIALVICILQDIKGIFRGRE